MDLPCAGGGTSDHLVGHFVDSVGHFVDFVDVVAHFVDHVGHFVTPSTLG